jgi:AmpD protein
MTTHPAPAINQYSARKSEQSISVVDGWLESARRVPSPNSDQRPEPGDLSLIVLHCISLPPGEFGSDGIERLFTNRLDPNAHPYFAEIHHLRVSAHGLIRRDGEIIQFVPFHRRAWHAGLSGYRGRSQCNDFSIGIELEGTDDGPYEDVQYLKLNGLLRALFDTYPGLTPERIVAHGDIAPGRKTDPGPYFDWGRLAL